MRYIVLLVWSIVSVHAFAQVLGPVVYSCDFAEGIPSDWTTYSSGLSHWEYRGPNTDPSSEIGARGSCSFFAQPISSVTPANGFIIFDSNYWDDGGTACANIGSGVDPGPHNAYVELPPQDFSAYSGVILTFQQQFRHFLDSTFVEVSINDGLNWSIIHLNQGPQSPQSEWVNVNLSGIATGYDNVKIRFHYTGTYYWWLLDDISIYEPNDNDLRINSSKYTTNAGINSPTPLLDLEYDQYPTVMIPSFRFQCNTTNIGAFTQSGVHMNVRIVRDDGVQTYNSSSGSNSFISGATSNYTINTPYLNPPNLGDYDIFYQMNQVAIDDNPFNNRDTLDYTISPYIYARDEGPCESFFNGVSLFDGYLMQAGNVFQSWAFGRVITAVGVAVGEGTPVGTPMKAVVYKENFEGIWGESEVHYVNYAEINAIGEEKIVVLPLITPITTYNDSIYIAMVSEINNDDDLYISRSGDSPEETSLLFYPSQSSFFYFINTPIVRLHVFSSTAVPGCNKPDAANYNPQATIEDGTCLYPGCAHDDADNYDPTANWDDGSCVIGGCMDPLANNFHPYATYETNLCQYLGCTDQGANNYDAGANVDDGTCVYVLAFFQVNTQSGCAPLSIQVTNQTDLQELSVCTFSLNEQILNETCLPYFEHLIVEPGIYTLTYSHVAGEFSSSYSIEIEVFPSPSSPIIIDNGAELVCLTCSENDVTWILNESELPNETGDSLLYMIDGVSQNGIYSIVTSNEAGCTSIGNEVTVFNASLIASGIAGCAPFQVDFENSTLPITTMVCTLTYGDGFGEGDWTGTAQHVYQLPGSYEAVLSCFDGALFSSDTIDVVIDEPIDINVYWNNITEQLICDNPDAFETITWYIGATTYMGPGPFDDEVGTWTIVGETAGGCTSTIDVSVISVNEWLAEDVLSVYPNPSDGMVNLDLKGNGPVELFLYNELGSLVWQKKFVANGSWRLDWSNMAAGAYHLRYSSEQGQAHMSVVIVD